jgi:hypothetical protein
VYYTAFKRTRFLKTSGIYVTVVCLLDCNRCGNQVSVQYQTQCDHHNIVNIKNKVPWEFVTCTNNLGLKMIEISSSHVGQCEDNIVL